MRRSISFGVTGLGSLIVGSLLFVACGGGGDGGDRPSDETGGSSGTGPTGGTSGASTGGMAGSGTNGGSAGSAGSAGSGGSGGSGGGDECGACTTPTLGCTVIMPPADGILNDFENLFVDTMAGTLPENGIYGANDENGMLKDMWWTGYFSGAYAYPDASDACSMVDNELTRSLDGGELNVTGTVGTYSGFGVWMEQCAIDMSGYSGISFRIGGNPGPSGTVQLRAFTRTNSAVIECRPDRGTCTDATCTPATFTVNVPATPDVITVEWADFTGGAPSASADPAEIWQFQFDFDWADGTTPYDVDVTLDDVMLVE